MRAKPNKRRLSRKVILTERDIELFGALWSFGVLTRNQIQQYFDWKCVSDINRRLRKLFDAGYLDRRFLARQFGTTPAVYVLGNESTTIVAKEKKLDLSLVNRRRYRFRNLSDNLLPHELLISEFGCLLENVFRRYAGSELHDWKNDEEIAGICNTIEEVADRALKPDAYGVYHLNKTLFNFFLEADLGTEPLSRIKYKVELYRSFKTSGLFERNFGRQAFRLIFITTSGIRARNISQAIPATDDLKIFIGNIDAVRSDPIFAPVWMIPGKSRAIPLNDSPGSFIRGEKI